MRIVRNPLRIATLALALGVAALAAAPPAAAAPTADDTAFVTYNAQMSLTEIALGKLVIAQAQSPAVRAIGQEALDQHEQLMETLAPLAESTGVTLPTAPSAEQLAAYGVLTAASPADFDSTFLQLQIAWNQKAIANVNAKVTGMGDPAVVDYARQYLAVATEQLAAANDQLWADGDVPHAAPAGSGGQFGTVSPDSIAPWAIAAGTGLVLLALLGAALSLGGRVHEPRHG